MRKQKDLASFPDRIKNLVETKQDEAKRDEYKRTFSIGEMAKDIGVSRQSLSNYIHGKDAPDYGTLIRIADYFSVSIDYLLGKEEHPTTDQNLRSVCNYTGLSPEAIGILHGLTEKTASQLSVFAHAWFEKGVLEDIDRDFKEDNIPYFLEINPEKDKSFDYYYGISAIDFLNMLITSQWFDKIINYYSDMFDLTQPNDDIDEYDDESLVLQYKISKRFEALLQEAIPEKLDRYDALKISLLPVEERSSLRRIVSDYRKKLSEQEKERFDAWLGNCLQTYYQEAE